MNRAAAWSVLPALTGVAVAVGLLVGGVDRRVYVSAAPALVGAAAGVLVTAALLCVATWRGRLARANRDRVAAVEAEAAQSRRRFVQRLDHELKNPLTALLTALSDPGAGPSAAVAHAQAERIRRLLRDLRRVADIETVELDLADVDVSALVHEAVDSAVTDAGGRRRVTVDVPTAPWPLPTVHGDADLLLVAVYNVVANALKYTQAQDVVEVRAREAPGPPPSVVLEIADTGPGVADDEQDLIWEELARGRAGAATPGSGVGLALVRIIVARHGGSVGLRSRVEHGTSVYLQLPARPPSQPR